MSNPAITIHTGTACPGNPGPGGYATVLIFGNVRREISAHQPEATNQQMELRACILGLGALTKKCTVEVYSNSAYVVNCFEKNWRAGWEQRNWKTASKEPVKNADLWRELFALVDKHDVSFRKVKDQANGEWINRCDQLAIAAASGQVKNEIFK